MLIYSILFLNVRMDATRHLKRADVMGSISVIISNRYTPLNVYDSIPILIRTDFSPDCPPQYVHGVETPHSPTYGLPRRRSRIPVLVPIPAAAVATIATATVQYLPPYSPTFGITPHSPISDGYDSGSEWSTAQSAVDNQSTTHSLLSDSNNSSDCIIQSVESDHTTTPSEEGGWIPIECSESENSDSSVISSILCHYGSDSTMAGNNSNNNVNHSEYSDYEEENEVEVEVEVEEEEEEEYNDEYDEYDDDDNDDDDNDLDISVQAMDIGAGVSEAICRPVSPWRHCYPWMELINLPDDEIVNNTRISDIRIRKLRARMEEGKRVVYKPDSSTL